MLNSLFIGLIFLLPLAGMITILVLPHSLRAKANFIMVLLMAALSSVPAIEALTGNAFDILCWQSSVFGNISIHIDSLAAWFILIINLTCINGTFYGIGYMKKYDDQTANLSMHWMLFLLFQSSMLWVCILQNGLAFLIAWELMSISSFMLVIFDHQNKRTLGAGINYLVQMHIGVLFLAAAFIWVYFSEGTFEFSAIEKFFAHHSNLWLFLLFFIGFGIKAGFIPLHSWLPQAHPAAPSHISGVMSGVIVKIGIYGIFRIIFLLKQDYTFIGEIIISISLLTGLFGILNAAVHRDFKRMLAYCTIENIGIIGIGIGLGLMGMGNGNKVMIVLGFTGALLHTLNHSLFKSLLFFTAGSVYQQTHTRDMEKLGGLIKTMPQTAFLFLIAAMAIGGLPPFNGFVSEFILYSGILHGIKSVGIIYITLMLFTLAGLALIGGISMLAFTKNFATIFLGNPRTQLHQEPKEVALGMRLPQYFILLIMISIGLFPQFYVLAANEIVTRSFSLPSSDGMTISASLLESIAAIGKYAMLFIMIPVVIYFIRKSITAKHRVTINSTWGCGYVAPASNMQYTGKSFSKSLGKLLNFILLEKKKYKEISVNDIFPSTRKHSSHYKDFFVIKIFDKVIDRLVFSMNYFQFIQNGKIQMYILYGIFFIVLVFIGTIFNVI
ncbi:hydrogenase-4 component B [mine drainage metagenome]|uniref:Hydrogenase-4 component B n=1 Tax=mine drainage metagenome TaxID=410659 RepID=A0A1J5R5M8_9ZZZZ